METDIIEVMKNQGLMITEQRMWIIEAVCQARVIADIEAFWLDLRAIRPISWATIYNTLRILTECGILQKESRGSRFISYRLIGDGKNAWTRDSCPLLVDNI